MSINIGGGGGSSSDLVADTTPQLGGPLDTNGQAINESYATVASHATTSAIWAAAGNQINFTGSETITAFPNATIAGSTRSLICAGAVIFTHAGNITVQGGATYTAKAGDKVVVTATSTTTFHVTPPSTAAIDADVSFIALAVAGLADAATPSVLTTAETRNKLISNYKSSGADHEFGMPAPHVNGNIIFVIGDEFQVDISPVAGDYFFLNGTAMAADEHIQNTADTLGQTLTGMCANINGTLRWMFYSSDSDWVEETP
jgi:hypothetical protein